MNWYRAVAIWFLIALAESVHGTIRQLFIAPVMGDLSARQIGVLTGSTIIFLISWLSIRWIGARKFTYQLEVGALWVVLTVLFEVGLGLALGYPQARILSDYNVAQGGLMGFGLLFMLFVPSLAAKVRGSRAPDSTRPTSFKG
jgi:hypothetical protein